jgi:hypothetical protein
VLHAATNVPACGFAEIRGTITASDSGDPLPDVSVFASGQSEFESVTTDANGNYTVTVPYFRDPGPYSVSLSPRFSELPAKAYLTIPPTVTQVISGQTTILDLELPRGGAIQGQIRAADTDAPLEGVFVISRQRTDDDEILFGASEFTDAEGNYVIYGLEEGNYLLEYDTVNIQSPAETTYYETGYVGRVNYPSEATLFAVDPPVTTTVNISIPRGSAIVGEIRRSDTNEIVPAVSVHAYLLDEDGEGHGEFITASSGSDFGTYYTGPLAPGKYLLFAQTYRTNGEGGSQYHNTWDLEMEWYKDVYTSVGAQVVEVPEIAPSEPISVDIMLSPGATITGVVTDADTGLPVPDIEVETNPSAFGLYGVNVLFSHSSGLVTDENGVYEIRGLLDGTYSAVARPPFDSEYQTAGGFLSTSPTVTVAGTGVYPNMNLSIRRGGTIEGVLTDDQGQPLPNMEVTLVTSDTLQFLRAVTSDANGNYSFAKIAPGEYRLRFDRFDPCGCFNNEYYTGEGDNSNGLVMVEPGGTTTGVNASMECNAPPPANSLYLPRVSPRSKP